MDGGLIIITSYHLSWLVHDQTTSLDQTAARRHRKRDTDRRDRSGWDKKMKKGRTGFRNQSQQDHFEASVGKRLQSIPSLYDSL